MSESARPTPGPVEEHRGTNEGNHTVRKTGVAQDDHHYSWRQIYHLCSVEVHGHE